MKFLALFSILILASGLLTAESVSLPKIICPQIACFVNPCMVMLCAAGTVCVNKCPCEGACLPVEQVTGAVVV
ncbi:hypothetical protein BsWGS_18013 [Bradybaena similaris]